MTEDVKQPVGASGGLLCFLRRPLILGAISAGAIVVAMPAILTPDNDAADAVTHSNTTAQGDVANAVSGNASDASGNALPANFFGRLQRDGADRIVADSALRELFDAIVQLDAGSPADKNRMRRRLSEEGRQHALTAEQLLDLERMFVRYLDYLERAAHANARNVPAAHDLQALRMALAARDEMRRKMLGQEMMDGFFGGSEIADRQTLRHLENYALPAEQRARYAADIASSPVNTDRTQARGANEAVDLVALQERVEAMRQAGASQAQIDAVRTAALGADIAERFSLADREAAAFKRENRTAAPFQESK